MALESLARLSVLKGKLLLNESEATFDNDLKLLLASATEAVERFCGRTLVRTTHTDERHTGDGTKELFPLEYPITTLTTVKIWATDSETFETETADYYELVDERMIYYPKLGESDNSEYSCWPDGTPNNIKLTYVAGYDNTDWDSVLITDDFDVPADLEYAVAKIAALAWQEAVVSEGRLGLSSVSIGGESMEIVRLEKGIPPDVLKVLMGYRRPSY